jgi:hypothetical protein
LNQQQFPLDRLRAVSYIAACALLAGCPGRVAPLVAVALSPAPRPPAVEWAAHTAPRRDTAIRFRFRYEDRRHRWGGRGTARVAPPDSLRFDYVGPLGLGAGAAVVVADSAIWADPEENFRALVPAVRMLWAALGIVRPPDSSASVATGGTPPRAIWRFAEGGDTLDYVATDSSPRVLEAEWRREGRVLARSRTELDSGLQPRVARIDFLEVPARFELTVVGVDTAAVFAPSLWRARR